MAAGLHVLHVVHTQGTCSLVPSHKSHLVLQLMTSKSQTKVLHFVGGVDAGLEDKDIQYPISISISFTGPLPPTFNIHDKVRCHVYQSLQMFKENSSAAIHIHCIF